MSMKSNKSFKVNNKGVDDDILPLPPSTVNINDKGFDERKSSSPNSHESKVNDNDDDINIVSKVIELVSPFITDYAYDINDIKLPKKLLYEGKLLLLILLLLLTTHYVRLWMF